MNNVKLSIFTGLQDTDIIDVGNYNPSIEGVVRLATGAPVSQFDGMLASLASRTVQPALDDLNTNTTGKYKSFHAADLLAAASYLNNLKIACDTYPNCTVKVETI